MKIKSLIFILLTSISFGLIAQNPGDTIKVRTFHYGSNNRDTLAVFPSGNLTFEKIIMKYSMRCKNGLVSDQTNRNQGCGEWDYSCNTYIVDSSKIEEVLSTQPNYVISNFTGTSFPFTSKAVYDYYQYSQKRITLNSIVADTNYPIINGSLVLANVIKSNEKSGKSQFIYSAAELTNAGLNAGLIQSLILNVNNNGGKASFLKIRIKHTNVSNLRNGLAELNNFTEVYFSEYNFVNGENRIVFTSPFNWNGIQNVLVEFSFTNTQASTPISFLGASNQDSMGIFTNNNYALDLSNNGQLTLDTNLYSTIKNEVSIAFWAFGDAALMPFTNSILYGTDKNVNNRQLNIHLPHSSNNIYFDCGFAAGGYDRINKIATPSEQGGKWNHWVFTKNATTGMMKIFLNGTLWFSGTGKVKPITLVTATLGNNFKGKMNNLAIWNKEVTDTFVIQIMNLPIEDLTNFSSNLVSYYPMNEGAGKSIKENKSNNLVIGENVSWTYDRGDKLNRNFKTTSLRPNIKFTRGTYNTTTQIVSVRDSIKRSPNTISSYSITSKSGVTPLTNDVVNLVNTSDSLYQASKSMVYNGEIDSLPVVDSISNVAEGNIAINNLTYYRRFPFYNEIMSFVTPYGIGLNLGINGKAWYYDMTDFGPILKGNKRIMMTLGGQTQEQNDIEFWFIVGTPPRNVLAFNQLWQGAPRAGSAGLASINNESRFPSLNVPILSTGKDFKIRSYITGHGSEGEFEQNGGTVKHMLKVNGNDTDFVWSVAKPCAMNPVFPQGGTWIYDRQGWCPGETSVLTENNITSKVTPGTSVNIDYLASTPPKAGAYNYIVSHQLISYGAPNFNLDARIMEVIQPSDKIVYGRENPICAIPKIVVQNSGATAITKLEIEYWINTSGNKQTYTWNGTLASLESTTISLPTNILWNTGMLSTGNQFFANIKAVNNKADDYALNNQFISSFNKPEIVPSLFTFEFFTNNNPTENSYKLLDEQGNVIDSQNFTKPNTLFSKSYNLGGCFKIVVKDLGEDGIAWWGNTAQGTGYSRLRRSTGTVLKTFQPDFGGGFEYNFTTNWALSKEEISFGTLVNVYPNPSNGEFTVNGSNIQNATITLTDLTGRSVQIPQQVIGSKIVFNGLNLNPGIYLLLIEKGEEKVCKKILIE